MDPVLGDERVHGVAEDRVAVLQDEATAEVQDRHGAAMLRVTSSAARVIGRAPAQASTKWTDCTELVTIRVPMA